VSRKITNLEFQIFGQPFTVWIRQSLAGGIFDDASPDENADNFVTAEEAFNFARPRAALETVTLLGYPYIVIQIIKQQNNEIFYIISYA